VPTRRERDVESRQNPSHTHCSAVYKSGNHLQSINKSIRALMQVDKPQRDRVNEYITLPC